MSHSVIFVESSSCVILNNVTPQYIDDIKQYQTLLSPLGEMKGDSTHIVEGISLSTFSSDIQSFNPHFLSDCALFDKIVEAQKNGVETLIITEEEMEKMIGEIDSDDILDETEARMIVTPDGFKVIVPHIEEGSYCFYRYDDDIQKIQNAIANEPVLTTSPRA